MKLNKFVFFGIALALIFYVLPSKLLSDDLGKANKYYEKYDYKYAIEIYNKLLEEKPTLEVAQKLANCYRFINEIDEAEKAYATVLTFPDFDPINYRFYADVLKQNSKYDEAKANYILLAEKIPVQSEEALKLAASCDTAKSWLKDQNENIVIDNEGGLNSSNSDFSPVKYMNGYLFVSDRVFNPQQDKDNKKQKIYGWTGNPFLKIYQAEATADSISGIFNITMLPNEINSEYHNGPATASAAGDTLIYTRVDVDKKRKGKKQDQIFKKSIYYSTKVDNVWQKAVSFAYNNPTQYSVEHPALNKEGNILYFASDMPGGKGGLDIYYSEKQGDGSWGQPINCGANINSDQDDVFPSIGADGKIYYSSKGKTGMGGLDLFSSSGAKASWKEAENLKPPFNSSKDDFGFFLFNDLKSGYLSSNRNGGKGLDDIYHFLIKPNKQYFTIEGEVTDKANGEALAGVQVYLVNKGTQEQKSIKSDVNGKFNFDLEKDADYVVRGDLEKYFTRQEGLVSTRNLTETTVFNVKFEMEKAPENTYLITLNNIYYDFDKASIRNDAEAELNKVSEYMSNQQDVNIELRSHTDARGKAAYNLKLSQMRAQAAKDYLVTQGADYSRLKPLGYGETQLINKCADGVMCKKEEHQANRRTEFKVVKVNSVLTAIPPFISRAKSNYF